MYPQTFLKSFWQLELRPEIFVAMSFENKYQSRFKEVIAPAVESIEINGDKLRPYRVDLSKTGDSILTEIMDGIAHCQLFLADVSSIGKDSVSGKPYRNGNVMYEVGLALACRQPAEVLLIRDDQDRFLFDVSTIPHMTLDFTSGDEARKRLQIEIAQRLKERDLIKDARLQMTVSTLTDMEVSLLCYLKKYYMLRHELEQWHIEPEDFFGYSEIKGLLERHLIECRRVSFHTSSLKQSVEKGFVVRNKIHDDYQLTKFGNELCRILEFGYWSYRDKFKK